MKCSYTTDHRSSNFCKYNSSKQYLFILNGFLRRTLQNTAIIILYLWWWQTETFFLQFFMSQFINVFVDFSVLVGNVMRKNTWSSPSLHFQISQRNLLVSMYSESVQKKYICITRHQLYPTILSNCWFISPNKKSSYKYSIDKIADKTGLLHWYT